VHHNVGHAGHLERQCKQGKYGEATAFWLPALACVPLPVLPEGACAVTMPVVCVRCRAEGPSGHLQVPAIQYHLLMRGRC
jgi:hypothetical protein